MNIKTAESVTPGHPDKMCDRISDAILDAYLSQDPNSRVAVETMGGHGKVYITGEVTSNSKTGNHEIKNIVKKISGITDVEINIVKQSPEIANGVDTGGAGDQGIMIGYATSETESMIPLETELSRDLAKTIYHYHPYDGKTQVTINKAGQIETIVASFQGVPKARLEDLVMKWYIDGIFKKKIKKRDDEQAPQILCNPAGDWNQGGFDADTGLTGRKLVVDNYGPRIPLGGGAFSGKDSTKVDRSAAYMARKVAVEFLTGKEDLIKDVYVRVAYAIGYKYPVEVTIKVNHHDGTSQEENMTREYRERFVPANIIEELKLREPKFASTAMWGHFGNGFEWDKE